MKHFLTLKDYTKEEILEILDVGFKIKKDLKAGVLKKELQNQALAMIFEKSSTRTRVSFEVGMYQLGGHALFLSSGDSQMGRGEPIKDTARVISSMCDMVMIRTFHQSDIEEFAKYSSVPVINALTDSYHPCQLLADYMTMLEYDKGENSTVAYVGDGNNMAHSWMMMACKLGFTLNIATPRGYEVSEDVLAEAKRLNGKINIYTNPADAVKCADVVTTDTWISMGQEEEKKARREAFEGFIVDENMMSLATSNAIFLHCLPAYREEEVSSSVLEKYSNVVFNEAENRLHAQKGLMVWLDQKRS